MDYSAFRQNGGLLVKSAVPLVDVHGALRLINGAFPRHGLRVEDRVRDHDLTYFPDLVAHGALLGLYDSVAPLAKKLIANPATPSVCQIAIRFPGPTKDLQPHIDGTINRTYEPHFSLLAAVFLSSAAGQEGALHVWPGSHLTLVESARAGGASGLLGTGRIPPPPGNPEPVQVAPGDVYLAHPLLAHSGGPNLGAHIRYAIFFRIRSKDQENIGLKVLEDPWLGWKSLVDA